VHSHFPNFNTNPFSADTEIKVADAYCVAVSCGARAALCGTASGVNEPRYPKLSAAVQTTSCFVLACSCSLVQ